MAVAFTRTADPAGVASSGGVTTYSAAAIGTEAHDRIVAVLVGAEVASDPQSATINVGGVAGARSMNSTALATFGSMRARIFYLQVPTGATADIAITWSAAVTGVQNHISVYNVQGAKGALNTSGTNTSTDMDSTAPLTTGSSTIPASGGMLAVAVGATDTNAKAWANLTEDLDEDAGDFRYTTSSSTTAGTATRTCTGTQNNEDGAMAWVTFDANASVERTAGQGNLALSTFAPTVAVTQNVSLSPARRDLIIDRKTPFAYQTQNNENFFNYSEDFSQSYWSKSGASISADATTAPDGTATADKLVESASLGGHRVSIPSTPESTGSSGRHTFSFYAKPGERSHFVAYAWGTPDYNDAAFIYGDLSSQTFSDSGTFGWTFVEAAFEAAPNGFYRVWVTFETASSPSIDAEIYVWNGVGDENYTGDGTSGIYIWGAQLNRGGLATYDPTPKSFQPGQGNVVLSTAAPTVDAAQAANLNPDSANLLLSTTAPTRVTDVRCDPASADLALSTFAPSRVEDVRRDPAQGNIALSTFAPTLELTAHIALTPGGANLVISTFAPDAARTDHVSLSPASADLTLSTLAPSAVVGFELAPTQGDLSLSAVAPSRVTDERRDPSAGQLALSTVAPSRVTDERCDPGQGDLALATTAPAADRTDGHFRTPGQGDLLLSTAAPMAAMSDNQARTPAAGDLTLSTAAPTAALTDNRDISPASRDLTLSTVAPTADRTDHRDLSPGQGNLTLSTAAPSVQAGDTRSLTPGTADLAITPAAPSVNRTDGHLRDPAGANLSLSTVAPERVLDLRRDPGQGNVAISTTAPTAALDSGSSSRTPAAGQLSLSTVAPTAERTNNVLLFPAKADLTLSAQAPDRVIDHRRDPAQGELALTGSAPAADIVPPGATIEPPTADLTLSTEAPTVDAPENIFRFPDGAQLSLSTFAALLRRTVTTPADRVVVPRGDRRLGAPHGERRAIAAETPERATSATGAEREAMARGVDRVAIPAGSNRRSRARN